MSLSDNTALLNQLKTILEGKAAGGGGVTLPELSNPGDASKLLHGYELIGQDGQVITGEIPGKGASNLTASGKTVTVPAGYYPEQVSKDVETSEQATPSITVSSSGLITASASQSAGYVAAGSKSATKQLTAQAAQTITPGATDKTIAAGCYLTGTQTIKGDANLLAENIVSGVTIFGVTGTAEAGGSGGGAQWVTVATELPNAMYQLGDVKMDGSLTQDDANEIMNYLGGSADFSSVQKVLANVDLDREITYLDATSIVGIINGTYTPPLKWATAVEYSDAKVGDDVKAVFEITISGNKMTAPTYAYVPWDGIIAIYSGAMLPAGTTGLIQILK